MNLKSATTGALWAISISLLIRVVLLVVNLVRVPHVHLPMLAGFIAVLLLHGGLIVFLATLHKKQ